jgi:hypothetical protein
MNIKKKYITVFILLILSIGMVYFIFTKETTNSVDLDKCLKYKRIATEDVKKGVAKYYHFGFAPLHEDKLVKMLTEKKIKIINKNCIAIPELMCYNEEVLKQLHVNK